MGYSTSFDGVLELNVTISAQELALVNKIINEDCYFDIEITDDFSGLKWNGSEKTRGMVEKINSMIDQVTEKYPDFMLTGELRAQGEEFDDRWILRMIDNRAVKIDLVNTSESICCPNCRYEFYVSEQFEEKQES